MDALAFGGPQGRRMLVFALRKLCDSLEAGTAVVQSIETSSSIDVEDCSMQYLGITYALHGAAPGIVNASPPAPLHS